MYGEIHFIKVKKAADAASEEFHTWDGEFLKAKTQ